MGHATHPRVGKGEKGNEHPESVSFQLPRQSEQQEWPHEAEGKVQRIPKHHKHAAFQDIFKQLSLSESSEPFN